MPYEREQAQEEEALRTDPRMGAVGGTVRVARAGELRGHPSSGALRRAAVAGRASEVGLSERTLYRRMDRFEIEGMESLFDSEPAKRRRRLPPAIRRLIVEVKSEYPRLYLNEIANIAYVRFGRRPDPRSVRRVLEEEPIPLKTQDHKEVRSLPRDPKTNRAPDGDRGTPLGGWSAKAIAGYLKSSKPTV
jgi:transposase